MIVELVHSISLGTEILKRLTVPKNALSCTGYEREISSQQNGNMRHSDTHVFREPINDNLTQTISIPHKYSPSTNHVDVPS
jgi:hypothetical protein